MWLRAVAERPDQDGRRPTLSAVLTKHHSCNDDRTEFMSPEPRLCLGLLEAASADRATAAIRRFAADHVVSSNGSSCYQ